MKCKRARYTHLSTGILLEQLRIGSYLQARVTGNTSMQLKELPPSPSVLG